jgi:hypothetical protein
MCGRQAQAFFDAGRPLDSRLGDLRLASIVIVIAILILVGLLGDKENLCKLMTLSPAGGGGERLKAATRQFMSVRARFVRPRNRIVMLLRSWTLNRRSYCSGTDFPPDDT